MYSFISRIRFSEVNKDKQLDFSSISNYFQDCSTFHSESLDVGISYLEKTNRVWMLSSWQIVVNRFGNLGEEIEIGTWAYGSDSLYAFRNFTMKTTSGEVLAYANAIWILVDTTTNSPTRITPEYVGQYTLEEKYPMNYAPRKIKIPKDLTQFEPFTIMKGSIDSNNHVNNGQYIKMAEEYIPEGFKTKQLRADYRCSAVLGDEIIPLVHIEDNVCVVVLANSEHKPYCIVEFTSTIL